MKNKKRTMILVIIALIAVVGILVGTTYAYFTASVTNATAVNENVITTGTMALEFTDGPEVKLENAAPGSQVEKTFKVKNIGTVSTKYDVYFSELVNTFLDKTDLVYTLESSDGGYNTTSEVQVPSTSSKMVEQQSIGVNEEHNYKLTVKFKETNDNQNDNANKKFSSKIDINKYTDVRALTLNVTDGTVDPSTLYVVDGRQIGTLPTPVPTDSAMSFIGWYSDSSYTTSVTSTTTVTSDLTNLYAKFAIQINENGYNYWNDNFSGTAYPYNFASLPTTMYPNYNSLIRNVESTAFIRTTYVNGNPTKHTVCLYYNNRVFCNEKDDNYGKCTTGGTDNEECDMLKNDLATALGETPTCGFGMMTYQCSFGSIYCVMGIDYDLECGNESIECGYNYVNGDYGYYCKTK